MNSMQSALTLASGIGGGLFFHRLRLPGGALIGAVVTAGILHITIPGLQPVGDEIRAGAQILIGTSIGAAITRQPFYQLRRIRRTVVGLLSAMLAMALLVGSALGMLSSLPRATAWLATLPGSTNDVVAVALDFDHEVGIIAAFHLIRQLVVLSVVPWIVHRTTSSGP